MKKLHFSVFLFFITITVRANTEPVIDNGQILQAQKQIERIEYFIRKKDNVNIYQSPNRQNGLRATFTADELNITPQDAEQQWAFNLTVKAVGGYKPVAQPLVAMHENTVQFDHDHHFTVEYVNDEQGIRQNFIIEHPSDKDKLTVQLQSSNGWKAMYRSATGLTFANKGQQLSYHDLKVLDAKGNKLPAHFTVQNNQVEITVDAKHAAYPLIIGGIAGPMVIQAASTLLQSNQVGAQMGTSVAGAGDINGDGYADVMIGAPYFSNPEAQEGAVFVFYGSAPNGINPNNYTILEKNVANGHFGLYIAGGGDVNGDGFADVAVGAPYRAGTFGNDTGAVYVYYGSSAGITTTPDIIRSTRQGDYFGISVAIVKDLNFDLIDDIVIGASNGAGYVTVVSGGVWGVGSSFIDEIAVSGTTGFGIRVADAGDVNGDGIHEMMVVAGEDLYVFWGGYGQVSTTPSQTILRPNQAASFGSAIAGGGDVNGDGYDDIVVGAKDFVDLGHNGIQSGAMYVFLGSNTGLVTTPHQIISSAYFLVPDQDSSLYGSQISFAGDVNKDGFDDVVVGLPRAESSASQTDEGMVWLYYGYPPGLNFWPVGLIQSNRANSWFGSSVAGAGDVNGDGYADLITGARLFSNGQAQEGIGLIFLGGEYTPARMAAPKPDSVVTTKTSADIKIFPNPVVNNLSVQFEGLDAASNTSIQIMNIYGIAVKTVQLGKIDNGNQNIDVSSLVPGTYFLMINNGSKIVREKIVKQ
ncbi:Por secretion system C-terminal sorting domain-containing protein [Chitinophaga sp. YR573]|uniref:FG-GAP-like repeat-containing protein n=1 Tax=Chitinophaga sp. YR573 TaxID=1881040 RepID=UPI0008B59803|nr:FG-GAP-like repeat-containing protein [Chitinophaga sp. YR573]SEW45835.1 Por secretion system C-terminal sorting domain-containing protein [Chitinophaga sp. YR573]